MRYMQAYNLEQCKMYKWKAYKREFGTHMNWSLVTGCSDPSGHLAKCWMVWPGDASVPVDAAFSWGEYSPDDEPVEERAIPGWAEREVVAAFSSESGESDKGSSRAMSFAKAGVETGIHTSPV